MPARHADRTPPVLCEWLRVEVADDGVGIADADQPRIFERFFKGRSLPEMEGNGLGLVIAREIVQLCRGQITFHSQPGAGTTFLIDLPVSPA
jgi:signal transduction histidine kinase